MDEKKLSEYRNAILEHILDTKNTFSQMNLFERFQCANEVMQLTKAYCCELFGLDPKKVKTFFIHGSNMGGIAGGKISELGFAAMALTTKKVMEATSIYSFYRTALHEFKHLDQINNMTSEDRETESHYDSNEPFNRFKWASSPSEGGADKFAFSQVLRLQRAILKQTDHKVRAGAEYISWCDKSLTSRFEHVGSEILYGVLKPFMPGKVHRHIGEKRETPKDPNDPTKILTPFEIRNMADMYPELFRAGAFKPKNKTRIEKVKEGIDAYIEIKEWMDGGMKGMPGEKTFAVQGFDLAGLVKGESVNLDATEILNLVESTEETIEETATLKTQGEETLNLIEQNENLAMQGEELTTSQPQTPIDPTQVTKLETKNIPQNTQPESTITMELGN